MVRLNDGPSLTAFCDEDESAGSIYIDGAGDVVPDRHSGYCDNLRGDQLFNLVVAADSLDKLGKALPQAANRDQITKIARQLLDALQDKTADQSIGTVLSSPRKESYFVGEHGFDLSHFAGVLLSAGLLSLGGPLWFNALKGLSSLRSIVANKEEDERERRHVSPDGVDGIGEEASAMQMEAY